MCTWLFEQSANNQPRNTSNQMSRKCQINKCFSIFFLHCKDIWKCPFIGGHYIFSPHFNVASCLQPYSENLNVLAKVFYGLLRDRTCWVDEVQKDGLKEGEAEVRQQLVQTPGSAWAGWWSPDLQHPVHCLGELMCEKPVLLCESINCLLHGVYFLLCFLFPMINLC